MYSGLKVTETEMTNVKPLEDSSCCLRWSLSVGIDKLTSST